MVGADECIDEARGDTSKQQKGAASTNKLIKRTVNPLLSEIDLPGPAMMKSGTPPE